MKTVICKSGIKGWQTTLRKNYDNNLAQFKSFCEVYKIHERLGYATPEAAWNANPVIQGSTNPGDLRVVNQETPVIFRKYKDGEIIAMFPYDTEREFGACNCYIHNGQHSNCHYEYIMSVTQPATEEEYIDLYTELENYGPADRQVYNLKPIKRINWGMYKTAWMKQNNR